MIYAFYIKFYNKLKGLYLAKSLLTISNPETEYILMKNMSTIKNIKFVLKEENKVFRPFKDLLVSHFSLFIIP